ncbi:MAG: riboflavin synthase [Chlamydiae bacterium]|nr:riboflavin synthase [Chlamydiota bacterium]MBI3267155.1 riboflavin synthase [Chlamydiota bacterium]
MFTGIVEAVARLKKLERFQNQWRLEIKVPDLLNDIRVSESLCVNGACLTVSKLDFPFVKFDLLQETYEKTNFKTLKENALLNIERALKMGNRLGGHFVTGHVDGVGHIKSIEIKGEEKIFSVHFPLELKVFLTPKGSVSLEGVSLTLGEIRSEVFQIFLIPHTLKHTNLDSKNVGDGVNLEVDILARYALEKNKTPSRITKKFLREHGFIESKNPPGQDFG